NRHWEDVSVLGGLELADCHYHAAERLAFWSCLSRCSGADAGVSSVSSLFAWARLVDLGILAHANPSNSVFRFLPAAGVRAFRSIRATRTIAPGRSLHFRTLSAYTFLPCISTGEYVSRRSPALCQRSRYSPGCGGDYISWRCFSPETD